MKVNAINNYNYNQRFNRNNAAQTNFRGVKGALIGGALGGGTTAAGVAALTGPIGLSVFAGYIAVNGLIGALAGHLAQSESKNK